MTKYFYYKLILPYSIDKDNKIKVKTDYGTYYFKIHKFLKKGQEIKIKIFVQDKTCNINNDILNNTYINQNYYDENYYDESYYDENYYDEDYYDEKIINPFMFSNIINNNKNENYYLGD